VTDDLRDTCHSFCYVARDTIRHQISGINQVNVVIFDYFMATLASFSQYILRRVCDWGWPESLAMDLWRGRKRFWLVIWVGYTRILHDIRPPLQGH